MTRDLRLLPAAALGWLLCLIGIRAGLLLTAGLVLAGLAVLTAAATRLRSPPPGRHRRRTPGRTAATVVLTATIATALLGWSFARAEVRRSAVEPYEHGAALARLRIDSEPRQVTADGVLLRATWIASGPESTAGAAGAGGPARADGPDVPVIVLADESWLDVVVGSQVEADARVVATEPGDDAAALLVPRGSPVVVARPPPVAAAVASLRAGLLEASAGLDPQARGLVPGIALGDDRELPAALDADLRTVSLTHVTAVSGAHVAMVLGLVMAATRRLPRPWRAGVAGLVLVALVLLVHPAASVLRSAAMGGVLLVGLLLTRPRAALPALWTSVIVLLALDPWLAGSFGFVLSVLATAGLLVASGPIADRLSAALPRPLALALAVPLAAQLACTPALALLQPRMPVHGVLANILAAPAVPPATVLGLAATLVAPLAPGLAMWLASAAGVATAWIASVATWCAGLPLATVPWWMAVTVTAAVVIVRAARHRSRRVSAGGGRLGPCHHHVVSRPD